MSIWRRNRPPRARGQSAPEGREITRSAQYNVWRVLSAPPQDVPLGLCDYTSIEEGDLLPCQAIFDPLDGSPEWGFPNYLLEYNPAHRWFYYSDMHPGEALVFKTSESDPARAQLMPHGAFDNPLAPLDSVPRISLEMRGDSLLVRLTKKGLAIRRCRGPVSGVRVITPCQLSAFPLTAAMASWTRWATSGSLCAATPMAL